MSGSPSSSSPAWRIVRVGVPLALLALAACGGGDDPPSGPSGDDASLSGQVLVSGSASALAGATVKIGTHSATTDANGHFELTGLTAGAATASAERPGYATSQAALTLSTGSNTHNFSLTVQEIYEVDAYSIYVPAGAEPLRGVIIALGGGVTTSGFATGGPLEPTSPILEVSLQAMGIDLRALAKSAHVALLGTTTHSLANSPASDQSLFDALESVAVTSGRAELTDGPVLMFGLGEGGSPESVGLASRNPERAIGVLVRVPPSVPALTASAALAVPTLVMLSALDLPTVNTSVQGTFSANRSLGGLWALTLEPGVQHGEATAAANDVNVGWIAHTLALRIPAHAGDPLVSVSEPSGWLGNPGTLEIAAWDDYTGNRAAASWLATRADADLWKALNTPTGGVGE